MKVHEECGVFGVMTRETTDVAKICYFGLYALQHRGQESCGIVVNEDGIFHSRKDLGLVSEVFTQDTLSRLPHDRRGFPRLSSGRAAFLSHRSRALLQRVL